MIGPFAKRGVTAILRGECPHSERLLCRIRAGAQLQAIKDVGTARPR